MRIHRFRFESDQVEAIMAILEEDIVYKWQTLIAKFIHFQIKFVL